MKKLEVLCVTMGQKDLSKFRQMNIHTDAVFANQADCYAHEVCEIDGHNVQMITTATRGVGINRNIALMHASAEYCLLADDDLVYHDDMPQRVIAEFETHPDADVMIFHFESDSKVRNLESYPRTKRWPKRKGLPFGGVRIAFRLEAVRKANAWFTTLFGGGCVFPSGEDSIFLTQLRKAGLRFYVSKETIGTVSYNESSWFTGYDEKYYYGKGAFYQAVRPAFKYFWMLYMTLRTRSKKELSLLNKLKWMNNGAKGYKKMLSFSEYTKLSVGDGKADGSLRF